MWIINSFSFPKSLRKQVRKSAEVWAEWRAQGSLRWDLAWHQEPPSPRVRRALVVQETLSPLKRPSWTLPGSLSWTNVACGDRPEVWRLRAVGLKPSSEGLPSKRSLIFKIRSLVCQTVPSPFPHRELFLKIHEIKKTNKKQPLPISHLNTKAKQSSKYLMK